MTLMLHSGANAVSYDDLRAVQTPAATESHVPVPHHEIVELLRYTLGFYGHDIVEEQHAIMPDGSRYFGLMTLRSSYGNYGDVVAVLKIRFRQLLCYFFGHRPVVQRTDTHELLGCARCYRLFAETPLSITYRRDVTYGEVERRMAAHPPTGYSFVSCNWKKRKVRFVSPAGKLKFVSF